MGAIEAKVTSKGQITLPLRVRKRLKVGPGDSVVFVEADDKIVVRSKSGTLGDMRGMLHDKARLPTLHAIEGWIGEARSRSWTAVRKQSRKSR